MKVGDRVIINPPSGPRGEIIGTSRDEREPDGESPSGARDYWLVKLDECVKLCFSNEYELPVSVLPVHPSKLERTVERHPEDIFEMAAR